MTEPTLSPPYTEHLCDELPPFDGSLSWLCWAYNEELLIADYLRRSRDLLRRTVSDFEIVVIDDCSTDQTNAIVKELARAEMPEIRLFRNERNLNVGLSSRRAIHEAKCRYLTWQTIDWSYDITYFRIFLEFLRDYDVVAGVRRVPVRAADEIWPARAVLGITKLFGIRHLTRRSDTVAKALVSATNYALIRVLFRMPLSDYQNVVIYPTAMIQGIEYEAASSFANPEGLLKSWWRGARFIEVPISFIPRAQGEAKGTRPRAVLASVLDIVRLWSKRVLRGRRGREMHGTIRRLRPEEWPEVTLT